MSSDVRPTYFGHVFCLAPSVSNGGLGMCQPNDFYLRVFTFWFDTEKALFQVILGLLQLSICVCRLRGGGGVCLRVCMCVWFMI